MVGQGSWISKCHTTIIAYKLSRNENRSLTKDEGYKCSTKFMNKIKFWKVKYLLKWV